MAKTYAQFMSQIDALRSKADAARRKEAAGEIKRVRDVIALYGLTAEDLGLSSSAPAPAARGNKAEKAAKPAAPPTPSAAPSAKYKDDAGHTWSGRGPKPGWLKAALDEGRSIGDFLAHAVSAVVPSPAADAGGRRSAGRKSVAAKAAAKPKFSMDGQSWSGRGPQPRWLKDALASGKTLDDLRAG